ncbi:hypothetical protein ACFVVM_27060 [Nocardia sp. NPDC058176]|uniref:hypothetical protein n=1 Tax=Nocardia sp. NPDC058176 TaxID=3346368 RepID=UPI0036DA25E1
MSSVDPSAQTTPRPPGLRVICVGKPTRYLSELAAERADRPSDGESSPETDQHRPDSPTSSRTRELMSWVDATREPPRRVARGRGVERSR